uniref:NADH-ubiquinone oxidoreductase chain 6 n=1 Tax=Euryusa optabilis TaxID=878090 RepID=A0A0S2M796_9COLE|nr:NADH dehydrogenase subunit 6 [Euryusa optabilis]ALO70558.1 NADH deshydrogenase subunit 6 [Euryusa optabilis]
MLIILMLNFTLSSMFLLMNHPMTMGIMLLTQTILIALITGFLNMNFWFSYILFLIMVGGMLVLFIYMTSIASNELFNYSNSLMIMIFISINLMLLTLILMDHFFINMNLIFIESMKLNNFNNYPLSLTKFFNYPSMMLIFMMITYLFITLIAIVKITKIEFGPLRQKY